MINDQLIEHITRQIIANCKPARIVLFGSYARGDAGPDSDLDIMVEMETDKSFYRRAYDVLRQFSRRTWPMDVLVFTPEEVRAQRNVIGTLVNTIEAEGKVLYDRSE